ncbi:hypothetical protein FH972_004953 [Carpinus fangiana]|uniref:Extra-large guanine nucleotide-binding protein 1 n=1 Tax=Carpinus fangiana TaxID=176857 RepID=A0A5N6QQ64_9ROSI|nr:hypothetical protein FH972_004953 [Carpinus fangiana]
MAGLLRKLRPVVRAIPDNDDDENVNNTDYSIASEYHGPPVSYDIPKVIPVDISHIPVASPVSSASLLNNLSLPVVQPIVKSSNRKTSRIDNSGVSGALACENGYGSESKAKLSDGNESSGTMGFSSIVDDEDDEEGEGFEDYMNPQAESCLSSRAHSSEASSCRQDDGNYEAPRHVKRPSIVTFRDTHEESYPSEEGSVVSVRPRVARNVKKGVCCRCLKGNRFTEKEVCIVCGAKYCYNCVLRAMGSMPEGRKCVICIGFSINEKRRGTLGMCSRLLKRLLNDLEVKRIMEAEVLCEVNQVPPALVFVNDEPLSKEELVQLQNCKHPPKNLRPGRYWYDKVSGFWGKEGQKPSQIISPELNVGGIINRKASNGNTNVLINSREITKEELLMLKAAGVTCEGQPHFWVSANGEYQEEGQNHIVGRRRIWDKTRTKIVCAVFSLPVPPDSKNPSEEEANGSNPDNLAQKSLHKLLLVGYDKSGTSTIYKQAKLLYDAPFSQDERQAIKFVIQRNLYTYLGILLEGREQFEEQSLLERRKRRVIDKSGPSGDTSQIDDTTIYSVGPRVKAFSDWLLQVMVLGNLETIFPADTGEYAPFVEQLWNDPAIQATYGRRNELEMLPRAATYFLDRAVEISRTDYEPSDMDILYAEGITSYDTVACMEFLFPKSIRDELVDSYQSIRSVLLHIH